MFIYVLLLKSQSKTSQELINDIKLLLNTDYEKTKDRYIFKQKNLRFIFNAENSSMIIFIDNITKNATELTQVANFTEKLSALELINGQQLLYVVTPDLEGYKKIESEFNDIVSQTSDESTTEFIIRKAEEDELLIDYKYNRANTEIILQVTDTNGMKKFNNLLKILLKHLQLYLEF